LQSIININEFNAIMENATPKLAKAMEAAKKGAQNPDSFFAKGPINSASVAAGNIDQGDMSRALIENQLSKLSTVDEKEAPPFEFNDSAT